jgi:phospholipid/cholesterol/gamma-HCH transport system substrate-binding protein
MKKISSEVKIGAIALVTIGVFIWLFSFLKGTELFTKTDSYHIIYSAVGGLQESSPVEINGYQVGVVQGIKFINDGTGRLAVTISVNKNFDLPVGTTAEITTATLIAGMKIVLRFGEGPGTYKYGDTIPGYLAPSIIDKLGNEIAPLKGNITEMVSTLDSLVLQLHSLFSPEFNEDIHGTVTNARKITGDLGEITGAEKKSLSIALENLKKFTDMLAANSNKLDSTLKNLSSISDTLAAADLGHSLASLKGSLQLADSLLKNMNKGNGTAGKLMKDDSLYVNLNNSMKNLDLLLEDIRLHPKRYVHLSVFGKKDK